MKTYFYLVRYCIGIISCIAVFTSQLIWARHQSSSSSSSSGAINDDHAPPCTSADCENRGQCIGTTSSPKCYCIVGFKGRRCQHVVRPGAGYSSNSARNSPSFSNGQNGGGGLVNGGGSGCPPSYCNNHGLCAVGNGVYVCQCAGGYSGSRCQNVGTSATNNQGQQANVPQSQQTFPQAQNLAQNPQSVPQTQQTYAQPQNIVQPVIPQGQSSFPQTQNQQMPQLLPQTQGVNQLQTLPQSQVINQGQRLPQAQNIVQPVIPQGQSTFPQTQNQQMPQLLPQTQSVNQLQTLPQSQVINQGQRLPQAQTMYQVLPANQLTNQAVSTPQYIQVLQPINQPNRQIYLASLVSASLPTASQNVGLLPPTYSTQPLAGYPAYAPVNGLSNTPGLTNAIPLAYAGKK